MCVFKTERPGGGGKENERAAQKLKIPTCTSLPRKPFLFPNEAMKDEPEPRETNIFLYGKSAGEGTKCPSPNMHGRAPAPARRRHPIHSISPRTLWGCKSHFFSTFRAAPRSLLAFLIWMKPNVPWFETFNNFPGREHIFFPHLIYFSPCGLPDYLPNILQRIY